MNTQDLIALLQAGIDDPMWANHFEINKATARRIIAALTRPDGAAPAGVEVVAWINYPCKIDGHGNLAGHGKPELSFKRESYGYDWNKAVPLAAPPTAPARDGSEPGLLSEAESVILALLRDTIDYGSPQLIAKGWANDFLRKLTGRVAATHEQRAEPGLREIPAGSEREQSLAVMVRRLLKRIRKVKPDDDLAATAEDYLKRLGLPFSPLRDGEADERGSAEPVECPVCHGTKSVDTSSMVTHALGTDLMRFTEECDHCCGTGHVWPKAEEACQHRSSVWGNGILVCRDCRRVVGTPEPKATAARDGSEPGLRGHSVDQWWFKELSGFWGDSSHKPTDDTRRAAKVALNIIEAALAATPEQRAEPQGLTADEIRTAMARAFALGQTYWQQADSDYTSQHKKADKTRDTFTALVNEIAARASAGRADV